MKTKRIQAIETLFEGSIVDDSEARHVFLHGYAMDMSIESVEQAIQNQMRKGY